MAVSTVLFIIIPGYRLFFPHFFLFYFYAATRLRFPCLLLIPGLIATVLLCILQFHLCFNHGLGARCAAMGS